MDAVVDPATVSTIVLPTENIRLQVTLPLEIWLTWPELDRLYVYAIAGGVSLFLAILSLLVVSWHSTEEDRRRALRAALVGLAAATFAILPLRVVLVPQVVPGLTRVNRILGLVVAVLLAGAAWMYRRETNRQTAGI